MPWTQKQVDALFDKLIEEANDSLDKHDHAMLGVAQEGAVEYLAQKFADSPEVKRRHWEELLNALGVDGRGVDNVLKRVGLIP